MIFFLVGTVLTAMSPNFIFLIAATTVYRLGAGALPPLCFSVLGDMFPPVERSKWVGLLNIPAGTFALIGPTMGGWFVDNLSWRDLYWVGVPILILCLILVPIGVPSRTKKNASQKIDVRGCILVIVASSTMILALSFAGTIYPWVSGQVIGLLTISLVFWIFFFRVEARAEEPIMDPQVLKNRAFFTVAIAGLLSFFGLIGMMLYFPLFLQGVQGMSATLSGQIITPFTVMMAFVGVPTGFMLATTKRYKWMYVTGYGILVAIMFGIVFFNAETHIGWAVAAATLAGLGLGAIPTINTLVVQYAVPKRLMGASMGAIFFSISMGMAISPAVLGSVQNVFYERTLAASLPDSVSQSADEAIKTSIGNPRVLLSKTAMKDLEEILNKRYSGDPTLFDQTVQAIRTSLEAALRSIFLVGAITMLLSFLLILTVPEIPIDTVVKEKNDDAA